MEAFKNYLLQKHYRPSTAAEHGRNVQLFLNWLQEAQLYEIENVEYKHLLEYVQYEQSRNLDVATINLRLGSIRRYYEFLQCSGVTVGNPAAALHVKGKAKTVVQHPFTVEELAGLYHGYKSLKKQSFNQSRSDTAHARNVVMLGLMVWQGLHSGELQRLETGHVKLDAGVIEVPATARSKPRSLALHPPQVLALHTYLHGGARERLRPVGEELLPGNVYNLVQLLTAELKGIEPRLRNAGHIRASVILQWLKRHNKRQVQYMAGHKRINSTEAYELQEMESLTDALSKHHPFG
jgi:site-specific recombinase XerD